MALADIYDDLYERADQVLKQHDPCKFHTNDKGEVRCAAGNPCCGGCKHLGVNGCRVKALACKVWTCHYLYLKDSTRECVAALNTIESEGRAIGVPMYFRSSKAENFRRYNEVG